VSLISESVNTVRTDKRLEIISTLYGLQALQFHGVVSIYQLTWMTNGVT